MTPKQKRRLDGVLKSMSNVIEYGHATGFATHKLEQEHEELRKLAAESPPKCGTCAYASKEPKEDLLIYCNNGKSNAEGWQRPDFGCVLHSEYEETP